MDFELCPKCLNLTVLNDDILIFENADNSELIKIGTCQLCKSTVEKHYPLTKGDPT
jgi:hypothetical protein